MYLDYTYFLYSRLKRRTEMGNVFGSSKDTKVIKNKGEVQTTNGNPGGNRNKSTIRDRILRDSRLSQSHNGSEQARQTVSQSPTPYEATSGQKLWAAIILGFVFAIISSPVLYYMTSRASTSLGGMPLANGGPNAAGLLLHTVIFIAVVWIIMW